MRNTLRYGLRHFWAGLLLLGLLASHTSPAQTTAYCATGLGGSCGGNDITALDISGTTLNATGLSCTSAGSQAYTSYPALGATTGTLSAGNPYTLNVTLSGASIVSVWVDFNHNFIFEASEWTQVSTNSPVGTPVGVALTVPASAVQGQTGLRVRSRSAGSPNGATDACTQFFSGETKDFTVAIGAPAACPTVTGASVANITATGATLSFTAATGAASYTVTTTPANGSPTSQTANGSPVALSGLTASTTYTVSIVSDCGGSGTSAPYLLTFRSGCGPAPYTAVTTAASYTQSFETGWLSQCATNDAPDASWRNTPATGNTSWRRDDDGASAGWTSPTVGAYTPTGSAGTHSARFHSYYAGAGGTGSFDLFVDLSAAGTKVLQFDYLNTAGNDSLLVQVSTNGGTTFGPAQLRLGLSGTAAQGWQPRSTSIASTSATTVIRFRGKVTATFTSDIGLDNLRLGVLTGVPGCATSLSPANGATGVVRTTSLSFAPGSGVTTGYDVYFGTTPTPPLVASNQAGQSYTPATLAASTTYYYQIVPRNANGPATGCGVQSFTTTSTFVYCNTNLGGSCGSADIVNVTVGGSGLNNSGTGCNSSANGAYTSFPPTGTATGTLLQGLSYPVSVTTAASAIISVWIDFNQNGTFEASEWTQVATASPAGQPATANVLVPATALLGQTGLRIRSRSMGNPNGAGDACTSFGSGEAEDYVVTIGAAPSCALPTNLSVGNLTTTSATLNFAAGSGTPTGYVVQYGPTGFNPAQPSSGTNAYTTVNTTSLAVPVAGLSASTTYQFYVTKSCGGGQTSQTAGPFTFRTLCVNPVYATLPYTQDFESPWIDGCSTHDLPSANWLNTPPTGDDSWRRDDDGASGAWTGPTAGAYTPAGSPLGSGPSAHSARFHSFNASSGSVGTLDLYANLTGGSGTPTLTFDYINTSGSDSLRVQLSTNGGSTFVNVAGGRLGVVSTWTRRSISLPIAGLTATSVVRLRALADFGFTDIGVDNVQLSFVSCAPVSGLAITGTSTTSVSLSFGPVAGATSYTLTLTPPSGPPTTQTATASPVSLTGLTPGGSYTVSVVSNCGGGGGTSTPAVLTFLVPAGNDECAGALNVPVQFGTTCVNQTAADNTAATTSTGVATPSCATLNPDIWFKVTVPVSGTLTVKTVAPTGGSNITDTVISLYSGACGSLTEIGCNDDSNGLYSQVALTGRTPGEVLYIRAWAFGSTTSGLIAVCALTPSNCPAPGAPSASNLTNTTAQLNWVAPTNAPAGATYEIEYGLQGFTPGSGTVVTGLTGLSYQLTNLNPASDYCFYVRLNCGSTNGSSSYVGPACFTTPLTVPANDNPCGAVTIGTAPVNGSTAGATTSAQPGISLPTCSGAQLPKDLWYAFTATTSAYRLAVTGTAAGLVRVFTSPDCANGPFREVFCQAGPSNNQNVGPVALNGLAVGTRYYVAVSGFGSSDNPGSFTIAGAAVLATHAQADTEALLVYPNPSSTGQLTLRLSNRPSTGQVTLLNALGQVVANQALSATPEQLLSTRGLATGVYTLRVTVAGQVLTRKVVLE